MDSVFEELGAWAVENLDLIPPHIREGLQQSSRASGAGKAAAATELIRPGPSGLQSGTEGRSQPSYSSSLSSGEY